jgi:hypothetical protein
LWGGTLLVFLFFLRVVFCAVYLPKILKWQLAGIIILIAFTFQKEILDCPVTAIRESHVNRNVHAFFPNSLYSYKYRGPDAMKMGSPHGSKLNVVKYDGVWPGAINAAIRWSAASPWPMYVFSGMLLQITILHELKIVLRNTFLLLTDLKINVD